MRLPENIVAYESLGASPLWVHADDWGEIFSKIYPNHRFYAASNVVSELAIESKNRELKLAELECEVKALKTLADAQKAKRVEKARKAGKARAERAVRGKGGRFVSTTEAVKPVIEWFASRIDEMRQPPATRRYIPERSWLVRAWYRLMNAVEKFLTGRQS